MSQGFTRKPVRNFFIKKSLQLRMIAKIVVTVLAATGITSATLLMVYYLKFESVLLYSLDKITSDLSKEHIINLLLPTLLISGAVNILVGIGVGLYASRKYAVPVYKIERWAKLLQAGKMTALIRFREKEELKEVSDACNKLTQAIRARLVAIKTELDTAGSPAPTPAISEALSFFELEAKPLEVYTSTSISRESITPRK